MCIKYNYALCASIESVLSESKSKWFGQRLILQVGTKIKPVQVCAYKIPPAALYMAAQSCAYNNNVICSS